MASKSIISHIEFCPMFDAGDYCVHSFFEDAQYFAVYRGWSGKPATRDKVFCDPESALHYMLTNGAFCGAKLWYNGYEMLQEIRTAEDILGAVNGYYEKDVLLSIAQRLGLSDRQACEAIWRLPLRQ